MLWSASLLAFDKTPLGLHMLREVGLGASYLLAYVCTLGHTFGAKVGISTGNTRISNLLGMYYHQKKFETIWKTFSHVRLGLKIQYTYTVLSKLKRS